MSRAATNLDLLPSESAFVAAMQGLGFGRFEYLQIRDGELVLNPWPTAVRDIKFAAGQHMGNPTPSNSDLSPQLAEFFGYVRAVDAGEIRELEVRHGLPFSMEVELPGNQLSVLEGGCRG